MISPQARSAQADWETFLSGELRAPVRVTWTRARRMPIQLRRTGQGSSELRLHGLFVSAPDEVRQAVARWARSGKRASRACELLDRWVAESLSRIPPPEVANGRLRARGEHHDLEALARGLLEREMREDFAGPSRVPRITWGRPGRSRTRHSLRLGSYDPDTGLARIHPVLDQPAVPVWFVRFVLHHELLHAVHPPVRADGRWIHHGREFKQREKKYVDHARALAWEERHMRELVRSARRGTPMRIAEKREKRLAGFLQRVLFPD